MMPGNGSVTVLGRLSSALHLEALSTSLEATEHGLGQSEDVR